MASVPWLVGQTPIFLTEWFLLYDYFLWVSLEQLFIMERDIHNLSANSCTPTLAAADGIVSDLLSSANSRFREFIPRDQTSPVNYVRGEPSKYPERVVSPVARNPFRHDNEENRGPQRLMSPASFEPTYGQQSSITEFSLHSTTVCEELVFDYDLSKVVDLTFV